MGPIPMPEREKVTKVSNEGLQRVVEEIREEAAKKYNEALGVDDWYESEHKIGEYSGMLYAANRLETALAQG